MGYMALVERAHIAIASSGGSESGVTAILGDVASVLTWTATQMTSIVTWIVGNDLAMIYVSMFIIGFAVALLFRILHTA